MITDAETDLVLIADPRDYNSPYFDFLSEFESQLGDLGIPSQRIPHTNDIWVRDFMPIQIDAQTFISYRYDPDYLQGTRRGYRDLKSLSDLICDALNITTKKTDIILDGGNIVRSDDCIILTDKVLLENRYRYSKKQLLEKMYEVFQVSKVVLIPWDRKEPYGHADGVLRFIDQDTVLVNYLYRGDQELRKRLKGSSVKYEYLQFDAGKPGKDFWVYLNFLQTKDWIIVPELGAAEDLMAYNQLCDYFEWYSLRNRIKGINVSGIIGKGGGLNCVTWTALDGSEYRNLSRVGLW